MPTPVVAIVGPTASGKSDLAIALALALGNDGAGQLPPRGEISAGQLRPRGEIINSDSMQLYRGMDIGTAKTPVDQRRGVVHHLLDVLDIGEAASVAQVQQWARQAIERVRDRAAVPIVVGGSALYTHAILDHMQFPGTDPAVRQRLEQQADRFGDQAMHARLAARDPAAARAILPGNRRRVVRALEVIELTGEPFTARLPAHEYALDPVCQLGLRVPRDTLVARIRERVDRMWATGLVDEVRTLACAGLRDAPTASRALGYAQVLDFLAGRCTEDDARDATVRGTVRFARRQLSWLRRDQRIEWLDYDDPDLVAHALTLIRAHGDGGAS
jgi:tRNA dimethylallyltransferase